VYYRDRARAEMIQDETKPPVRTANPSSHNSGELSSRLMGVGPRLLFKTFRAHSHR
jgi:hypothetical protein